MTDRQWDDPLDFKEEGIVIDYKTAGVDIDAGKKFVEDLQKKVPALGGFGGMIKVPVGYEEPILVSGADGVGTKLSICTVANDFTTIGQDLVAMCVNDVITCGANPITLSLGLILLPSIISFLSTIPVQNPAIS